MKASELVKKLRDAVFDHPDYGPVVALGVMDADYLTSLADLIEAQAKAIEEMRGALAAALERMEGDELKIEGEWGLGRDLEELERAGELVPEIIRVREILASHSKEGEQG